MHAAWHASLTNKSGHLPCPACLQAVAALPAYQRRLQQADSGAAAVPVDVDLNTVMWTDPDVLFRHDIDSCSLPMPRLLSIGPEVRGRWCLAARAADGINLTSC